MIKVSVNGALGKMGSTVCNAVINNSETELIDSVDINSKNHKTPNGKLIHKDFSGIFSNNLPDVIVDFTNRETFINLSTISIPKGVNIVSGSTGLLDEDYKLLDELCKKFEVGVLSASNFAIGAVLMMKLAAVAGKYFDYADLIESHHENKIDAPSTLSPPWKSRASSGTFYIALRSSNRTTKNCGSLLVRYNSGSLAMP